MADADSIQCCALCAGPILSRFNKDGTRRKQKFCGKACANKADRLKHCRKSKHHPNKPSSCTCEGCGAGFVRVLGTRNKGRFCGPTCYGRWQAEQHAIRWADLRIRREWERRPMLPLVVTEIAALRAIGRYREKPSRVPCGCCNQLMVRRKRQRFCAECLRVKKRAAARRTRQTPAFKAGKLKYKSVRRAREAIAAEIVVPQQVFARDGWKCQLCGIPTPRRLRGTYEPNAPELDHIVPLAKGGGHTWANVQCACRRCNQRKGAKAA